MSVADRIEEPGSISTTLLQRVKARDGDAWRRLVLIFGSTIYGWSRGWGLQPSDASDVVQEVFESVAGAVGSFERAARHGFTAWLYTITRNKVRDHYRRQSAQPGATGGSDARKWLEQIADPGAERSASEFSPPTETTLLVRRALALVEADFEAKTWQAFWQTTVEEHLPADVAVELGMSVLAVRKAKSRVLARLRSHLVGLLPK